MYPAMKAIYLWMVKNIWLHALVASTTGRELSSLINEIDLNTFSSFGYQILQRKGRNSPLCVLCKWEGG
jgi:hypothetical protein